MRLMGLLLVVAVACPPLGWYRPFEGVCVLVTLAIFGLLSWFVRRERGNAADNDEFYEPASSRAREFVLGALLGLAWLVVAAATIGALSKTRVHAWFVDEPGQGVASELDMLARNGAWSSILTRLDRPLPALIGPAARVKIDRLHYMALVHAAAEISDPLARCNAHREAAAFADAKGIDPIDRFPFTCQPAGSSQHALAKTRIRVLKQELDSAGRSVFTVSVTDSSGTPLSTLGRGSFLAIAHGREVAVASAIYAPTVVPARSFAVVIGPMRSHVDAANAEVARGILFGMMRSIDHVETLNCCSRDADLVQVLTRAISSMRNQPGGIILLSDGEESVPREPADALVRDLRSAHAPMHLVVFGNGGGLGELGRIARESGGRRLTLAANNISAIRKTFGEPLASEGVYFIALDGAFRNATVAMAAPPLERAQ